MNEQSLYRIFAKKIKLADPESFWYKIPDTKGLGGKRPFDGILVCRGTPVAIEFKMKGKKATKYQNYQLERFKDAGGLACVFFSNNDMDKFISTIIKFAELRERG